MSKILNALRDVDQMRNQRDDGDDPLPDLNPGQDPSQLDFVHLQTERKGSAPPDNKDRSDLMTKREGRFMKNQWVLWFLIIAVIGIVLFAFNYQGGQDTVPLSEIFPSQDAPEVEEVEYVFMDTPTVPVEEPAPAVQAPSGDSSVQEIEVVAAPVTVPDTSPPAQADLAGAQFTIQVASFQKSGYARKVVDELKQAGHQAFLVDKDLGAKGVWYRVYVGKFQSRNEASQYISRLPPDYKQGFILKL